MSSTVLQSLFRLMLREYSIASNRSARNRSLSQKVLSNPPRFPHPSLARLNAAKQDTPSPVYDLLDRNSKRDLFQKHFLEDYSELKVTLRGCLKSLLESLWRLTLRRNNEISFKAFALKRCSRLFKHALKDDYWTANLAQAKRPLYSYSSDIRGQLKTKIIRFLEFSSSACAVAGGSLLASNIDQSKYGFIILALSSSQML